MKTFSVLFLLILIFKTINCQENQIYHRCGFDDQKIKPIPIEKVIPIQNEDRRLDNEDEFKDFNIYLDLINIKNDIVKYNLQEYESLFIDSLNKAVETLESLLKVKNIKNNYILKDENIINILIPDWNKTLIGTNAVGGLKDLGIDLFIFGRFDDKMDEMTLANAGARYTDMDTGQPIVGLVNINTKVNYGKIKSKEYFQSIILHEFTHILGFSNNYFNKFNFLFNKTDEFNVVRYYIKSPKVLEVAKKYFDCQDIDGVELEESGGSGTAGSHWEARILLGDYMNGVVYPEEQAISEFTLALLEDLGYYKANYYTGGLMRYGKHKGCDFIKKRCVSETHEINPKFENEFYDSIYSPDLKDASCTSGRQSRTYFAWWLYSNLPIYYRYFSDPEYGGFSPADYCPVPMALPSESENAYYTGHCSSKGNGGYGTGIAYRVNITINNGTHIIRKRERYNYTSESLLGITGEINSDHSFCYQSSLIRNDFNFSSDIVRAICYESFCSDRSLTVKINDDYILCPRAGGKIEIEGYKGFFLCPDYNLICSGTVICNDMFDCVNKKSELKEESYNYDYIIKTSQNIEDAEIDISDNENNYELSFNGICPKDCKHCYENKKCIKCRDNFKFVGSKKNQEITCLSQTELSKGYYLEKDIYYSCISNCDSCSDDTTCTTCSDGYGFINNKCIKIVEKCQVYNEDGFCEKCENNYAFKENDRTICLYKENNFINYYSKDEGISFYPCEKEINSCSKCGYNSNENNVKCNLCSNDYALYENENKCYSKINLNNIFYYLDDAKTKIDKCSNVIQKCNECQNGNECKKCDNNYYMINDIKNNCIETSNIAIDEYFLNNEQTIYYSCNNNLYHQINNCKKCSSKSTCTLCQDGYTFINGDKSLCVEKNSLGNNYIQDPSDQSNYIKCENKFDNCNSCDNNKCLSCKEEYIFINEDYSKCILKSSIDLDYYFTNDDITYYSCMNENYKNREECKNKKPLINEETTEEIHEETTKNIQEEKEKETNKDINEEKEKEKTEESTEENISEKTINETPDETTKEIPAKTSIIINNDKEEKQSLFEIYILQVQIINKYLKIFLTVSMKLEKDYHFKFTINLYKKNNRRNLEGASYESKEIDLYLSSEDNDIESGKIISLISQEKFEDIDRIVIKEGKNTEYLMKVLNNNNKILDTQENNKLIQNKEMIDFSNPDTNYKINEYYIESASKGCQFDLISKNSIDENSKKIILTFSEKNNKNNNVKVECTLSSDNNKNIPCYLDKEINNKYYVLENYIGSNENNLFYIKSDKDKSNFELNCSEDKFDINKIKKIIIIIIVAISVVIIIILITLCICCCKNKKTENVRGSTMRHINFQVNSSNNNYSSSARHVSSSKNHN